MRVVMVGLMGFAVAAVLVVSTVASQPPDGKEKKGPGGKKGPPRFELGKVLPPFARDELQLTTEQEKQIAELEANVRVRLEKILTTDQKKQLQEMRPPGKDKDGPPGKTGRPE